MKANLPPLSQRGFGLAETAISLAIIATALLAILGFLGSIVDDMRENQTRTAAGVLARRLAAEASQASPASLSAQTPVRSITLVDSALQTIASTNGGNPRLESEYESGSPHAEAVYFGVVEIEPDPGNPLLHRIILSIETPAAAPRENRRVIRYVTLSSQ